MDQRHKERYAMRPKQTNRKSRSENSKKKTKDQTDCRKEMKRDCPVAIIGMGCLFPGSPDKESYWRTITAKKNLITPVPPSHFLVEQYYDPDPKAPDRTYCRQGGFLDPVAFDPIAFNIPPANLDSIDTSQLLSLVVARQVIEEAFAGQLKNMDRSRIGVVLGVAAGLELLAEMAGRLERPIWIKAMREAGLPENEIKKISNTILSSHAPWKENTFPGLLGNIVAGRIAQFFDLGGINCTNDAACASSFSALSQALYELYQGSSDVVITGGADTNNGPFLFVSFSKTPALSPTHDCRPFSDKADGMALGEGIGMVALKRLDDAERDGDRIHAVIHGIGASSDGRGVSIFAPLAKGQARALRRCYAAAGYGPETVELVEAHGTGTPAGDIVEVKALCEVFEENAGGKCDQWCALGSVKSQIGHTKSAAAVAGLIKAVMGLRHKVLPPTIKVERPDPRLEIEKTPFYLNTESRPWVRDDAHPRRASVSSFGFGGTNFHVTIEAYTGKGKTAWRMRNVPSELVLFCEKDADALKELCIKTAASVETEGLLAYLARTSQENADVSAPARLAVVATDEKDLSDKLKTAAGAISETPNKGFDMPTGIFCALKKADPESIAFLFPGQGASVYPNMGADLAMEFDEVMAVWDASASLDRRRKAKEPLYRVVYPIPAFSEEEKKAQAGKLSLTQWSQPSALTASISISRLLKGLEIQPACVGGHSLGELSALLDAGVLDFQKLLDICFKRGELMSRASEASGAMTAVFEGGKKLRGLLDGLDTQIIIANYNSPSQAVLSGPLSDMEEVEKTLKKQRIAFKRLPVSAAFHSAMMNAAGSPFLAYLKKFDFKKPVIPVYANISGKPHSNNPQKIREALAQQVNHPVLFVQEIESMYAAGVKTFIEAGPGNVLTGFVKKILAGRPHTAVNMDTKGEHGITSLWKALGRLFIAGVSPCFSFLWKDYAPISDPRKRTNPKYAVMLSGTNYGKPYPPPEGMSAYPRPNPPKAKSAIEPPDPLANTGRGSPKNPSDAWTSAYQEIQQQMAQTHAAYQKAVFESHMQFLKAVEAGNNSLSAFLCGRPPAFEKRIEPKKSINEGLSLPPAPQEIPIPPEAPASVFQASPAADTPDIEVSKPENSATAGIPPTESSQNIDFTALLLDVVVDKTGYPKEILSLDMDIEADLGIDSIKRVEILSAIKDAHPWLPEIDPADMGNIRTLNDVLCFLQNHAAGTASLLAPETAGQSPSSADQPKKATEGIARYSLEMIPSPPSGFAMPGIFEAASLCITQDSAGVAEALSHELAKNGVTAGVVGKIPEGCDGLIFLDGLKKITTLDEAVDVNRNAFLAAKQLADRLSTSGGVFVTVQNTGGDFGLSGKTGMRAWLAGIPGLVKTAGMEWPKASVKAIDIDPGRRPAEKIARSICAELLAGGPELEVGLMPDGGRFCPKSRPKPNSGPGKRLDENSIIVASGGGRGVTAKALIHLSCRATLRLAILGRTRLEDEPPFCRNAQTEAEIKALLLENAKAKGESITPLGLNKQARHILAVREIKTNLKEMEKEGAQTIYLTTNVTDEAAVAKALSLVRKKWGPITGIVHGAGVIADKRIQEKTADQFKSVFSTKVKGLYVLLKSTARDPLDMICLFSSIAAHIGNAGQCDYAMANEVLNRVACAEAKKRKGGCLVKSINWGPWESGMVSSALKSYFEKAGVPLIPLDAGAEMFVREITESDPKEVVVVIAPNALAALHGAASVKRETQLPLKVNRHHYPFFDSHCIRNIPVVPAVMVIEWFARAAEVYHPKMKYVACRDLKVLRGIRLENFKTYGKHIKISCEQASEGDPSLLFMKLKGANDETYYSAWIEISLDGPGNATLEKKERIKLPPWGWNVAQAYRSMLFHGPGLRVIRSLEGVSESAATAVLEGTGSMPWPRAIWKNDVAALDGGLQLAILWGLHVAKKKSLPTKIGACRRYRNGPLSGPVYCALKAKEIQNGHTRSDISFFNKNGELTSMLCDVEMHMLADKKA
jgi:acyl transferase domain-containing protein/NAD(P)-dependent dehydrogenase (short-subunit alcohol dehydrogenase family)/acyl carrier protein